MRTYENKDELKNEINKSFAMLVRHTSSVFMYVVLQIMSIAE